MKRLIVLLALPIMACATIPPVATVPPCVEYVGMLNEIQRQIDNKQLNTLQAQAVKEALLASPIRKACYAD